MRNKVFFPIVSNNALNYVVQLLDNKGDFKNWETTSLMHLIDSIPVFWKINILDDKGNSINLCIFDCHLSKIQKFTINRLNSK